MAEIKKAFIKVDETMAKMIKDWLTRGVDPIIYEPFKPDDLTTAFAIALKAEVDSEKTSNPQE